MSIEHSNEKDKANNLFVTSKNKTTNSPILEFKVLHKGQRAFLNPFLMVYYFLFLTLKNIFSIAFSFQMIYLLEKSNTKYEY